MRESYLSIKNISKSFGRGKDAYTAIEHINLDIERGEFVSIIGHSGCGKSTLLSLIAGLTLPSTGTLTLAGKPITGPGSDRGMVFQSHGLLPWLSIYDNVYVAIDAVFPDLSKPEKREDTEKALKMVGLWAHKDKKPAQISGGMKQRTSVARAFAVNPRVLVLDEPFGALDALTRVTLQDELVRLWSGDKQAETVILVTHDIDEAIYLSDRIVVMSNGPRATIEEVVEVKLDQPRDRRAIVHTPEYAALKDRLLFLLTNAIPGAA